MVITIHAVRYKTQDSAVTFRRFENDIRDLYTCAQINTAFLFFSFFFPLVPGFFFLFPAVFHVNGEERFVTKNKNTYKLYKVQRFFPRILV